MKRLLLVPLIILAGFVSPALARAASHSATFSGGGWTLTLTSRQASYGEILSGTFRSTHKSFKVQGDWIPAADQGSDLLRLYGRPFGMSKLSGLVGVAVLSNTCKPNCASSKNYQLAAISPYPSLSAKLPGVNKSSLIVRLQA